MFNVSCIQLTSDNNVFSNLEKTTDLIINSIKKKADLIITPENTSLFTLDHSELLEKTDVMSHQTTDDVSMLISELVKLK